MSEKIQCDFKQGEGRPSWLWMKTNVSLPLFPHFLHFHQVIYLLILSYSHILTLAHTMSESELLPQREILQVVNKDGEFRYPPTHTLSPSPTYFHSLMLFIVLGVLFSLAYVVFFCESRHISFTVNRWRVTSKSGSSIVWGLTILLWPYLECKVAARVRCSTACSARISISWMPAREELKLLSVCGWDTLVRVHVCICDCEYVVIIV